MSAAFKQSTGGDVTALVLSGGGARGAYAVGVLQAIIEILGLTAKDSSLFQIFSGTSVGSINAAFLASHAQRGDLGIYKLREVWETLGVNSHLKVLGNVGDLRGLSTGWFANAILIQVRYKRWFRATSTSISCTRMCSRGWSGH